MVMDPALKPAGLEFLGPQKEGTLPLIVQFLIADIGIDLMRMAAVHTRLRSPLPWAWWLPSWWGYSRQDGVIHQ